MFFILRSAFYGIDIQLPLLMSNDFHGNSKSKIFLLLSVEKGCVVSGLSDVVFATQHQHVPFLLEASIRVWVIGIVNYK